jgi:MFS family permease
MRDMNSALPLNKTYLLERGFRWYDYITINIYYLGSTVLSQTNGLLFPLLVQMFVGQEVQGTYLGTLRLVTLMVALLMQALMGLFSDRSTSRWGRRRPFILVGTIFNLIFVALVGISAGMSGMAGFFFLFSVAILSQVAVNAANAAAHGLIPDIVPGEKRGKFSAVKALFEAPLPLVLVPFTIGRMISQGLIWPAIGAAIAIVVGVTLLTLLVKETPRQEKPEPINWTPILRLLGMTAFFTAVIVFMGWAVRWVSQALAGIESPAVLFTLMGLVGLAAMALAVGIGVYFAVRVSIGDAARAHPSFTWWVINRLAFLVGAFNISTFAVYFIQARMGYPRETAAGPASILMAVVGVFILFSTLPSGFLADRFGRKPLVAFSGIAAAVGTAIALAVPDMIFLYIGGSLIGIATGFFFSANWALGTDLVPKAEAARYLGISNLAGAGAGAVGAYIGGPIADYFTVLMPQAPGLGYILLFAIYGSMFLLSVFALPFIEEQRGKAAA